MKGTHSDRGVGCYVHVIVSPVSGAVHRPLWRSDLDFSLLFSSIAAMTYEIGERRLLEI